MEMTINDIWTLIEARLKPMLDADLFSIWISRISPVEIDGKTIVLGIDDTYAKKWIEDKYLSLISDATKAQFPSDDLNVVLRVVSRPQETVKAVPKVAEVPAVAAHKPISPKSKPSVAIGVLDSSNTFDEFVVGPSNTWAFSVAKSVADAPGNTYNPFFIYGDTGLGKTHLMQAVGNKILESPSKTVAYVSTETLLNEYIDSIQRRAPMDFRNKYRNVDALLIDDIQFMAGKQGLQEEFFHTFNALYNDHKQIIITSDRPPSEINQLEDRLVSRFQAGITTQIECPNFETRLAILRYKQAHLEVQLSDEVQNFIAENVTSNVRALEGAMKRAISFTKMSSQALTVEILRQILRDLLTQEQKQAELTLDAIQQAVAEHYGISKSDILSEERLRTVAQPRQYAMYLARRLTAFSFPEIAQAFQKTHGTVVHACKLVHSRVAKEMDLKRNLSFIIEKLGQDPKILEL